MPAIQATTRIALSNILFTTDFSPVSRRALQYAEELARWYGARILVAHVVRNEPYLAGVMEPIPVDLDLFWNIEKRALDEFVATSNLEDVAHEEILRRGELWDVISEVVQEKRVDLVVVGTHGRQGLKKVVLGSAAEKIYRQAKCPVLTVGPEVGDCCPEEWRLKEILFPTDFSETSLRALPYALSLAEEKQATLTFVHMMPLIPDRRREEVGRETRRRLAALMPDEPWCKPNFMVDFDFPAPGILNVACECKADLIVMGVGKPGAPGLTSHLPWSTASDVVSAAPCPVLTVRG